MIIRDYKDTDEKDWLRCRLISFYDSSYADDVIHKKPVYDNDTIDLVAEADGQIVGFIEIEIEKECKEACYLEGERGGVIWNLGVLPEYHRSAVASSLLTEAIERAKLRKICRFEAWTQDDFASNKWYEKKGFDFIESYLNVYATGEECKENDLIKDNIGAYYGVRSLNFEAPITRKEEMVKKYAKVHEVKLYELKF